LQPIVITEENAKQKSNNRPILLFSLFDADVKQETH